MRGKHSEGIHLATWTRFRHQISEDLVRKNRLGNFDEAWYFRKKNVKYFQYELLVYVDKVLRAVDPMKSVPAKESRRA